MTNIEGAISENMIFFPFQMIYIFDHLKWNSYKINAIALTAKDFVTCHQQFIMAKEVRLDIVSKILQSTPQKRLRIL